MIPSLGTTQERHASEFGTEVVELSDRNDSPGRLDKTTRRDRNRLLHRMPELAN